MKELKEKAYLLIESWTEYKTLHYSHKTLFDNAVDIELEKEKVAECVYRVYTMLYNNESSKFIVSDFERAVTQLDQHLRIYKDQIMFELLRNGIDH